MPVPTVGNLADLVRAAAQRVPAHPAVAAVPVNTVNTVNTVPQLAAMLGHRALLANLDQYASLVPAPVGGGR